MSPSNLVCIRWAITQIVDDDISAVALARDGELSVLTDRFDTRRHVTVILLRGDSDLIAGLQVLWLAGSSVAGDLGVLFQGMGVLLATFTLHNQLVASDADQLSIEKALHTFRLLNFSTLGGNWLCFGYVGHSNLLSMRETRPF